MTHISGAIDLDLSKVVRETTRSVIREITRTTALEGEETTPLERLASAVSTQVTFHLDRELGGVLREVRESLIRLELLMTAEAQRQHRMSSPVETQYLPALPTPAIKEGGQS